MPVVPFPVSPVARQNSLRSNDSSQTIAISFSEIISALSFAIDLTEGAVPGHALRTCVLGMRIGRAIGLPAGELESLYYALLLKDVGCSSNAARMCQIVGGDDRAVKNGAKLADWTRPHRPTLDTVKLLWQQVLPGASAVRKLGRILKIGATQHKNNEEMITLRCERGASITRKLGLSSTTSEAIRSLDEHWDGSGYPEHRTGHSIPVAARILAVAQHLDVFACERTPRKALQVLQERSGRWFDPELVLVATSLDRAGQLWDRTLPADDQEITRALVLELAPTASKGVGPEEIDRICEAFADVVDAKSPFTYSHSQGVAEVAVAIGEAIRLPADRLQLVHRAALLHDLGKLAVSNTILDKPGQLTGAEWSAVVEHPRLSKQILARIEPFAEMAAIAGAHHEKLDGTGYPDRLSGDDLCVEARIVAVADIYRAMTEGRPYRAGLSHEETVEILRRMTPHKLDTVCVEALDVMCSGKKPVMSATEAVAAAPRREAPGLRVSGMRAAYTG